MVPVEEEDVERHERRGKTLSEDGESHKRDDK